MSILKQRKSMTFNVCLAFALWTALMLSVGDGAKLYAAGLASIPSGTPLVIEVNATVSSETANPGDTVPAAVASDVEVDGTVVIKKGTTAVVRVATVDKRGAVGAPGEITLEVVSTTDVDGKTVNLSGSLMREGKSKQLEAILLFLICIIFLFTTKGKAAEIAPGSQIRATTV